jgi:hypothetical protein
MYVLKYDDPLCGFQYGEDALVVMEELDKAGRLPQLIPFYPAYIFPWSVWADDKKNDILVCVATFADKSLAEDTLVKLGYEHKEGEEWCACSQ